MVNPTQAKLLQAQLEETQARLIHKKQALTKLGLPTYTLHERDYNPGYTLFRSNSERVDILANIFPCSYLPSRPWLAWQPWCALSKKNELILEL